MFPVKRLPSSGLYSSTSQSNCCSLHLHGNTKAWTTWNVTSCSIGSRKYLRPQQWFVQWSPGLSHYLPVSHELSELTTIPYTVRHSEITSRQPLPPQWLTFLLILFNFFPLSLESLHPLLLNLRTLGINDIPLVFSLVVHSPSILYWVAPMHHCGEKVVRSGYNTSLEAGSNEKEQGMINLEWYETCHTCMWPALRKPGTSTETTTLCITVLSIISLSFQGEWVGLKKHCIATVGVTAYIESTWLRKIMVLLLWCRF